MGKQNRSRERQVCQGVGLIVFPRQSVAWHANCKRVGGNPHSQLTPLQPLLYHWTTELTHWQFIKLGPSTRISFDFISMLHFRRGKARSSEELLLLSWVSLPGGGWSGGSTGCPMATAFGSRRIICSSCCGVSILGCAVRACVNCHILWQSIIEVRQEYKC